jgi:hypothetical protein
MEAIGRGVPSRAQRGSGVMVVISESQIYAISTASGVGVRERLCSILRSYLWSWDADFIGYDNNLILFRRHDYGLVLSVPMSAFSTPAYARFLVRARLDQAFSEKNQAQEIGVRV